MTSAIDITFDFRRDTPPGKDPDALSPTLKNYHKLLWSKPLPCGTIFSLSDLKHGAYLHHQSNAGEFFLSSDSIIHTFSKLPEMAKIIKAINPEEVQNFKALGYTIGGMLIFPSKRVDGKATINGARGMHPRIKDRIDLTLECIRRHYENLGSPLSNVLNRNADFFRLFKNFSGYLEFFLLQDLVSDDFNSVKYFLPFNDFKTSALPGDSHAYLSYKCLATDFVNKRNQRIIRYLS
jgi:hypothetical protein